MNLENERKQFWKNIEIRLPDDCWNWMSRRDRDGYGLIKLEGKQIKAHQLAFYYEHGIWPSNVEIRHFCNNRRCCNPKHLIDGTHKENMEDASRAGTMKGRHQATNYGILNIRTIITEKDVIEIKRLSLYVIPTEILKDLRFKGKVSLSQIYRIIRGESRRKG
jgi:hypothetical protein